MRAYERFIKYAKVHTQSDPDNEKGHPSSNRQFILAEMLMKEMRAMGIQDARLDKNCYVYGTIPATPGYEGATAIGLIAHMDTSPDAPGDEVRPVLHENYDGGDLKLPSGRVLSVKTFPDLAELKGKTLITASGDTLLGADDKAGIAEILTTCEEILKREAPHGKVCVAFTPDEEIGAGADNFDVEGFGADYAYTVDGGQLGEIEYETFNGARAVVTFTGVEVHPGEAKDIMVNAAGLLCEYDRLLPNERPGNTEGRQGYFHLYKMVGEVASATAEYLLRDHDAENFDRCKQIMHETAMMIDEKHGNGYVRVKIEDSYRNMGEVIEQEYHLVQIAEDATRAAGCEVILRAARGGTDGSALSYMGLPCPNLGTGGYYFHGPNECIAAEDMDKVVDILLGILERYAKKKGTS